jgi:hypothetical protein
VPISDTRAAAIHNDHHVTGIVAAKMIRADDMLSIVVS